MKQIKKLARRGMLRTLGLLGAVFLGIAVLFGLLSAGQGIETMLIMILTMGLMFLLIFLIFGLVGVVPYVRVGKMVKYASVKNWESNWMKIRNLKRSPRKFR